MEETIVIGVLLISCVILGITMLGDAEIREAESSVAEAQSDWFGLADVTPAIMTGDHAGEQRSRPVYNRAGEPLEPIEEPRILARHSQVALPDNSPELSDDVLNRYRYFADDLSRLREELAYSPVRAATLVMQRQNRAERSEASLTRHTAPPIGTAFAQKRPLGEKLADIRNQLPVAESVSMRV